MISASATLRERSELQVPVVSYDTTRKLWRLERNYWYEDREAETDAGFVRTIFISKGFEFDLSSIPRAMWPIVAPFELSIAAPLLHDYLYRGCDRRFDRADADRIFRTAMRHEGVGRIRRNLAYAAVRAFGASAYRDDCDALDRMK